MEDVNHNKDNLHFFLPTYECASQVDTALHLIPDRALTLEVQRYRHYHQQVQELTDHISKLEDEMFDYILGSHECVTRLAKADTVRRIRSRMLQDIQRTTPWVAERGHSA